MAEPRSRLVSSCSPAMGEFTNTFAEANGLSMSELIRRALAQYMDYTLSSVDADPPKAQKAAFKKLKDPNALSKRQLAIKAAIEQARANAERRKELVAQRLAEGAAV
jgi:hypothetical protein